MTERRIKTRCVKCGDSFARKPNRSPVCPKCLTRPEVGKVYRVTNYHTGDFVATCVEKLFQTARYRVSAPLGSALSPGDEVEIAYRSAAQIAPVMT
jgi:hypothetical protein